MKVKTLYYLFFILATFMIFSCSNEQLREDNLKSIAFTLSHDLEEIQTLVRESGINNTEIAIRDFLESDIHAKEHLQSIRTTINSMNQALSQEEQDFISAQIVESTPKPIHFKGDNSLKGKGTPGIPCYSRWEAQTVVITTVYVVCVGGSAGTGSLLGCTAVFIVASAANEAQFSACIKDLERGN